MKKLSILSTLIFLVAGIHSLWAWGPEGHRVVALIAQHYLTPNTLTKLNVIKNANFNHDDIQTNDVYMGKDQTDDDLKTFFAGNDAQLIYLANWADGWDHKTGDAAALATAPWHFVDLPITGDITDSTFNSLCQNDACVVNQIQSAIATLKNTSADPEARMKSLLFAVHFCGDIHQPLHCSNDNDRGGNDKPIAFFGKADKQHELHRMWDEYLIGKYQPSETAFANELIPQITDSMAVSWQNLDVKSWAIESNQIARNVIYPDYAKKKQTASVPDYEQADEDTLIPYVKTQLEKAGVRLAYLLNTSLSEGTTAVPEITVTPSSSAETTLSIVGKVVVNVTSVKVHEESTSKSKTIKTVHKGDVLDLLDTQEENGYYKVQVDGLAGYIYGKYATIEQGDTTSESNTAPESNASTASAKAAPKVSMPSSSTGPASDLNGAYVHYPNHDWTPGLAGNPDYDQQGLCSHTTSTKAIRNVTQVMKKQVFQEYGIDYSQHANYEVDHFIPLCLGGQNDLKNLWPEPYTVPDGLGARQKDKVEVDLFKKVCSGQLTLDQADSIISTDWVKYYNENLAKNAAFETSLANDDN